MDTLIRMKPEDLNSSLIDFIKSSFKGKRIALHIYEDEMDETEYLLSDPQHKTEILQAVKEVEEGKNLKVYAIDDLKEMFLNEAGK